MHCFKKGVFYSKWDPIIFPLVVLSLVVGSSRITSFTFTGKIIISLVERVFISAQLQNRRFSWRCTQGWDLVYIRATPHHTGLIPSRWTQLQQDVQPFVGTNLIPYRYVTTYTSPCNMKDPIQATWTTSTLSPYHCHLALLVLVRVSFDVVLILDPY